MPQTSSVSLALSFPFSCLVGVFHFLLKSTDRDSVIVLRMLDVRACEECSDDTSAVHNAVSRKTGTESGGRENVNKCWETDVCKEEENDFESCSSTMLS